MATLRTVTVDPDGGADYTSLNSAESTEQGNISASGSDEYVVFECTSSGSDDTSNVTFGGWTTGPTFDNRIEVQSPSGSRHAGVINQSLYVYTAVMSLYEDWNYIHHLQFVGSGSGGSVYFANASSGEGRVSHCIFTGCTRAVHNLNNTNTIKIWNNLAYECGTAGYQADFEMDGNATYYCENNTSVDKGDGDNYSNGGTCTVINCVADGPGASDSCFLGTYETGSDFNTASNSDDPGSGANNKQSVSPSYENAAADDYHLA